MKKQFNKKILGSALLAVTLLFSGCYSVFNGGTGGQIVDAESTSTPKQGIANVDIYAYTESSIRDSDYNRWKEGTVFAPSNSYYGHTTTDTDGSFVISNIVWKETKPDFGKDADYTTIYLLYYHENYGLTKDQTVITSDSTNNTVYAELKAIRKTTALNISINDVATSNATPNNVLVTVTVPQSTDTLSADPKDYKQFITGSGIINISYPRWKNAEDKANGIENEPEVSITYAQSADKITWKACANADNDAHDYAFYDDDFPILKTIKNDSYYISLYGKATKINIPTVSGTYGSSSDSANDGIKISMKAKDSEGNYTIDCGEVTTGPRAIGNYGTQEHGYFTGLGSGYSFTDDTYTEKNKSIEVEFYANGNVVGTDSFRSDTSLYTVRLN